MRLKETAALGPAGRVIPLPADLADIEHADQLIASARAAAGAPLDGIVHAAGTRVNGIAPGYFRTELTADLFADRDRAAWVLDRIPVGRFGDPADLAGAVVFLLSPASGYITGQLLPVDGGWLAG